jgi:hypothetical protein
VTKKTIEIYGKIINKDSSYVLKILSIVLFFKIFKHNKLIKKKDGVNTIF